MFSYRFSCSLAGFHVLLFLTTGYLCSHPVQSYSPRHIVSVFVWWKLRDITLVLKSWTAKKGVGKNNGFFVDNFIASKSVDGQRRQSSYAAVPRSSIHCSLLLRHLRLLPFFSDVEAKINEYDHTKSAQKKTIRSYFLYSTCRTTV